MLVLLFLLQMILGYFVGKILVERVVRKHIEEGTVLYQVLDVSLKMSLSVLVPMAVTLSVHGLFGVDLLP